MAALQEKHWQVSGIFVEQSIIFSESRANIVQQTAVKYLHYCSQFTQQGVEVEYRSSGTCSQKVMRVSSEITHKRSRSCGRQPKMTHEEGH